MHHFREEHLWPDASIRAIIKKVAEVLKKVDFIEDNVNPCLYMKKTKKGVVYLALNIDNNLFIGNPEAIDEIVELPQKNGKS